MKAAIVSGSVTKIFKDVLLPNVYTAAAHNVPITVIGLFDDKRAIGALSGFIEAENSFTIASLYVQPPYRRKGGGRMLIQSLIKLLNNQRIPVAFLSFVEGEWEWDSFLPFMNSMGFEETGEFERLYTARLSDLYDKFDQPSNDVHIAKLSGITKEALDSFFEHTSHLSISMKGSDLLKFKMNQNLSFSAITDSEVLGYLLCGQIEEKNDSAFILFSYEADPNVLKTIFEKFIAVCRKNSPNGNVSIYIPMPDDRMDSIFSAIDCVKNIQHNYIL